MEKYSMAYKDMWKELETKSFDPRIRRNIKVNDFWGEAKTGNTLKALNK
jgi:hypothetical protein